MRLHHLEVTAFGPFTGTVSVDFDELSQAGLFLLSGATGAGKTSVLDAVCFALYGDVPGDRSVAKRLRSDRAPVEVATRVVLEATLAQRRFRITRSPSWERPKRRGSGTTTQQASVVLMELVEDEWRTLTTRLDEAGHLVSDLLGMTLTQFVQVAMLPQGRFQAFLRSSAEERKRLLERLFRTERFADVERWLRERRVELRRRSEELNADVAEVVSRISETAAVTLPDDWDVHDLGLPAGDGTIASWARTLVEEATEAQAVTSGAAMEALAAESETLTALDAARAMAEKQRDLRAAAAAESRLLATAAEHEERVRRVEAAQRAEAVAGVSELADQARREHQRAASLAPSDLTVGEAKAAVEKISARLAHARALEPVQRRLDEVARELTATAAQRDRVLTQTREQSRLTEELPQRTKALGEQLAAATEAAAAIPVLRAQVAAVHEVRRLTAELVEARARHEAARTAAMEARTHHLDVRQARLDGIAAELAGDLAVGADCPVCGSHDHPRKASPADGAPDAAAEKKAEKAYDDASAEEHLRDQHVRDLATRLQIAQEAAGETDEPAEVLAERLAGLERTASGEASLRAELSAAEESQERSASLRTELETRAAELETTVRHLTEERERLEEQLRDVRADHPGLAALLSTLEREHRAATTDLERLETVARAAEALTGAERTLTATATRAGFDSPESALAAALPPEQIAALNRQIKTYADSLAAARATLDSPGAAEILATDEPDLQALAGAHRKAADAADAARSAADTAATRAARLDSLHRDLTTALAVWAPVRDDLEVAVRVASFAEGKSSDNQLHMSLSAYVVAYRLTQVVAAANERLAKMSDQRYALEHSAAKGAGDRRGGLALLVRDDWSGESRDPATLSGGETFVVSLALALGLADVIMNEAGGQMLDTLFVDEGFGSLDADTLDDVLDVLDTLREGGRIIGVVSHVTEMRERIPTQLSVTKGREGSTLKVLGV
ncbi:exonuclease SbcC [Nocardioides luteus]|uniref:Nuclease SbcCD subunit C n=1 Tax=Nocardioides luteus TaxID=1844 RepID=A0ABQ5T1V9_9ACTN|nr:SMC family ATPase [Nocardioides luteus]MDR7310512.1 exonuclease SbcC [Nocardioides luteus]GGR42341.1 nuclease SbcCD subunit C [Nocardioides luteus]GLJ69707.1 nuclease SbcCD subunit C [Nocardioides luteus]